MRKLWIVLQSRIMRSLAIVLTGLADACLRFAKVSSRSSERRKGMARAQIGWRSLLGQLGTQRALAAALDAGILGNDMPRASHLPAGPRILVIAAHQDDETIAAAGTLLLCAKSGCEFRVVYYTDGATAFGDLPHQQTSVLRYDEARCVWHRIAGVEPLFWGYPNRDPLLAPAAGARLSSLIREFKPTAIFVPVFLEQPLEHKRMSELLAVAHATNPIPSSIEVWGYQITTRAPGNVVVDITQVAEEKYAINRLWVTQNMYLDYAHLAQGRDMASSYYLKGNRRTPAAHAETFLVFDAPTYVQITREFLDMPARAPIVEKTDLTCCPPPNFFIIGMQKSGTYWLTALLDLHPQIRSFPSRPGHEDGSGEAHLFDILARLDTDYKHFARSMRGKLDGHFAGVVPDSPPTSADERAALSDAIRLRFNQYCHLQRLRYGKPVVGEKTAETVHHLDLLEAMYPQARKICILRDPRDRALSFFFHQKRKGRLGPDEKLSADHIESYLDRVKKDYTGLLRASSPIYVLTYEALVADPQTSTAGMLRFLGFEPEAATVEAMVNGASFQALANRTPGQEDVGSHFRKGVVGDWRARLEGDHARHMADALEDLTHKIESRFGLDLASYRCAGCPKPEIAYTEGRQVGIMAQAAPTRDPSGQHLYKVLHGR